MRLTSASFCHEDEENDPNEDYEEYLACAVCGDNGEYLLFFLIASLHVASEYSMSNFDGAEVAESPLISS